jgi:hypothetical protein
MGDVGVEWASAETIMLVGWLLTFYSFFFRGAEQENNYQK